MKTLALLRHGKSNWDDALLRDFDRPLNKRGRIASELMGAEMKRRGLVFDVVLASPAERVRETLVHVASGYGQALRPRFVPEIYQASCAILCTILRSVGNDVGHVLMVGHNPGLQQLACLLVKDDALIRSVEMAFPTAALAYLELPDVGWDKLGAGVGHLAAFVAPRTLSPVAVESRAGETR